MVPASEFFSRQLAILAKAIESVSANLSIVAVIGIALLALLPDRAGSTLPGRQPAPPPPAAAAAPIELVRAKPVPIPEAPPPPDSVVKTPAATKVRATALLKVAARRTGDQRSTARQQESGELGKSGTAAQAEKTPVASADAKATAKAEPSPPPPDEWSDEAIIGALKDCLKRLAPLGAEIEVSTPVKQEQCGTPAPVVLKRIGTGPNRVEFQPPPLLNCAMVASLHSWVEKTLQPAAQEFLGSPIVRVRNASGYVCRNRVGSTFHSDRLSEHALANAIDISGFVTADGRMIEVARNWGPTARDMREQERLAAEAREAAKLAERQAAEAARAAAKAEAGKRENVKLEAARKREEAERMKEAAEAKEAELRRHALRTAELRKLGGMTDAKPGPRAIPVTGPGVKDDPRQAAEAAFLRRLHKGACGTFGTVLGPEANDAHRDHFHFDLAQRRRNAFCE